MGAILTISQVMVGGSAGLAYTPDTINAAIGDMVIFTFLEQNHTATQSAFTTPCEALAGGVDSGFMPNPNSSVVPPPQMAMQVTVATPICKSTHFLLKPPKILTRHRVLLQAERSLWEGHDFLHQPHCQQDPSHVSTNGRCSKRYRNYPGHCWWLRYRSNVKHCCRRCRHFISQQWYSGFRNRNNRRHWSLPMLMSLRRSVIPQRCHSRCRRFRRSSR